MIASPARFLPPSASSFLSLGLSQRLTMLALLFAMEWIPLSDRIHRGRGLGILFQLAAVAGAFLLGLIYVRARGSNVAAELQRTPIGWRLLGAHAAAFLGLVYLAFLPIGSLSEPRRYWIAVMCCTAAIIALGTAFCAFVPPRVARPVIRKTGAAWVYASFLGVMVWVLVRIPFAVGSGIRWDPADGLSWKPATDLTFNTVDAMLRIVLRDVVADRATMTLGSPAFNVTIFPGCSGFEGTGLMMLFSAAWLWFLRRDFRFPAALVLIPGAMTIMWVSNAVRIAALILIGVAGAPEIAVGGFHSQAGWIAFNGVALSFALLSLRLPYFTTAKYVPHNKLRDNPTVAYLMPLVAILAAAMISRAASSGFEGFYPLRFAAAAGALWLFRKQYGRLDWRIGWFSIVAGAAVFLMWLAADRWIGGRSDTLAAGLAALPGSLRVGWLACRTAAAVVTVPIAEELAFRGFLIRRLMSSNFESIESRSYSVPAIVLSSLAFGLMHEERWLAGLAAGLAYTFVFLRRGSIGDAVAAHATTNALLAAWVLMGGRWFLW